jgi:hypothetical protein
MRKLSLIWCSFLFFACSDDQPPEQNSGKKEMYYPYAARQAQDYEFGNPYHTKAVLDIWRAYDVGSLRQKAGLFAPEVTLMFPDRYMKGPKDSILMMWQERRDRFHTVQSFVDGWIPVQSKELGDQSVLVWGYQESTDKDGKIFHKGIIEKWNFNASGQIQMMQHFINENWQSN